MAIIPPPDIGLPPPSGKPGGWGDKLEVTLIRFFGRLLNSAKQALAGVLRFGFETFLESIEPNLIDLLAPTIDFIRTQADVPPEIDQLLSKLLAGQHQVGSLLLSSMGGTAVSTVTGSVLNSFLAELTYTVNQKIRPARLDHPTLYAALLRRKVSDHLFYEDLRDQGWSDERITVASAATRMILGPAEAIALWLRKDIGEPELDDRLTQAGVEPEIFPHIKRLAQQIPGPGDLVRFALREAWDDSVAARWGYDADFSPQFADWMEKLGFSADWAQKYWRAHWELPSVGAGYEMLHRGIITADQLQELMKLLDIPPGWRGPLTQLSYNVPTRVDVRRMFEMGVVNRDQVKRVYFDLGYDETWAELLTAWTEQAYAPEDRERTRSDILDGYQRGLLGEAEARTLLADLGYTAEAISFYIAREQAKAYDKLEKERLKLIERQFKRAIITDIQAQEQMAALGLQSNQIIYNMELWRTAVAENVKRPSIGRLEDFYLDAIISADQMRTEMRGSGFATRYISWYMQSLDAQAAERAAAELERARKEEERVRRAREKTAYEQAAATLDVAIAQQSHVVASARQALNEQLTTDQLAAVTLGIEQLAEEIAALRAEIARQQALEGSARDELRAFISDAERERLEEITETAEIEIARLAEEQAGISVAIRLLQEEKLITPEIDRLQEIAEEIAAHQTAIAQRRQAVAAQRSIQGQARADLRAQVADDVRQRLERQMRDARASMRQANVEISELRAEQESLRVALAESITVDTRRDLEDQISAARTVIARLRVEKAQLRLD